MNTFVKSVEALVFGDFFKTVDHAIVVSVPWSLSLKSDFDDLERLHDEHLEPSRDKASADVL